MQIQVPSIIQSIQLKSLLGFELEIDVKRDDLIHPHISGNKWRKLQGYLTQENLYKTWVSFGGAYSNHILALSALGKLQQIRTIGIIRGEELNTNSNSMLQQAHANGMELRFVSRELYKDKLRYFKDHFDTESHLFINEGGLGKEVLPGLHGMLEELTKAYDLIFLPFGTGATAYGLGYLLQDSPTQVKAVSVIKDASQELQVLKSLFGTLPNVELLQDFHCGGYAKSNESLVNFVKDFNAQFDCRIEPIYSGKAMYALVHYLQGKPDLKDKKILFIHTGGLAYLI